MAKSFLVSPGRAYLVIAEEGTKIVRANGTLIDTVPEGANAVSITVDTHEIIVMDNAAKIQQLYNGNSGNNGVVLAADGEDAGTWKIEIVNDLSELPAQGSVGIIYMVRTNRTGSDRYDDYIWVPEDNAYELLGRFPASSSVDLSNVAKTNAENTFTGNQRVNGTLTARDISVMRSLYCEQKATIGTAAVNDLAYDTASGSIMTVSHVTILTSLRVAPQATIDLPGVTWGTGPDGDYIYVTRKPFVETVEIIDTAKVSNVLTLGAGSIRLDGSNRVINVINDASGVRIEPSCVQVLSSDATLMLKGDEISMQSSTENRTLFSFTQDADEKLVLTANAGIILNGTVSMPDTLTVKNLNVTGTVTGITTGGTPTVDFSNGVTIMQTLTADDVVADTVTASTLSADSGVSVDSESVIYRNSSDGAMYIQGDVVNATRVVASTILPLNIQGATFVGSLVMTKDNALQVWKSGGVAEIRNGNLTGFSYAQIGQCSIMQNLVMDTSQARSVTISDTLVVKDLVVTGIATGIQGSGGDTPSVVDGDLWVSGAVTAMSVLAHSVGITDTTGELSATVEEVAWVNSSGRMTLSTDSLEMLNVDATAGVRLDVISKAVGTSRTVQNVLLSGVHDEDSHRSVVAMLRVPSLQLGPTSPDQDDPTTFMLALYDDKLSTMCCLGNSLSVPGELEWRSYVRRSANNWDTRMATLHMSTLCAGSIRSSDDTSALSVVSPLCAWQGVTVMGGLRVGDAQSYTYVDNSGNVQVNTLSVMNTIRSSEVVADRISAVNVLAASVVVCNFDTKYTLQSVSGSDGDVLELMAYDSNMSTTKQNTLRVSTLRAKEIDANYISTDNLLSSPLTSADRSLLDWLAANQEALSNLISSASA